MDKNHINHEQLYRTPLYQKYCVRCGRDPALDHLARYYKRFDAIATTYLVAEGKKGRGSRTKGKAVDTDSVPLLLREQVATTDALRDVANQLRWLNGFDILDTRE
ncbi:hypothetical protein EG328_010597 [Venturia inaequalis]|uniref:Uncharacterized protein n=1 Tax=Venturia inaequalis TaxID=5025 RepID=A0A8H3YNV4_VENIN|nr:hypothetical protein EG328_010597 [Venturia inaequalis]